MCGQSRLAHIGHKASQRKELEDLTAALPATPHPKFRAILIMPPDLAPRHLDILLHWPARLTGVFIGKISASYFCDKFSAEPIQNLLDIHSGSLLCIKLGIIFFPRDRAIIPNFSTSPFFQYLSFSASILFADKPRAAAAKLSALALGHLNLSYSMEDQHETQPSSFHTAEVVRLTEYVKHRAKFDKQTSSSKPHLQISFTSFGPPNSPWESIQSTNQDLLTWAP